MAKILITGAAGFIGSNFIRYWLAHHPDDEVLGYDALTYAGNLENLRDCEDNTKFLFVRGDIGDMEKALSVLRGVDIVVNFAAESHNDRGVLDPGIFLRTNVLGTQVFLEAARKCGVKRFHHISTCEVFGDLPLEGGQGFLETDPYQPKTPYNASKASANHVVMSYFHTYGMPVTISHCANNYGPYQFPEKLIPLFVTNALEDRALPLFSASQNKREWTHVDDHARALDAILSNGKIGEAYNIGTGVEKTVEEITDLILRVLDKPQSLKTYVPDRLGHDRRYLLNDEKLRKQTGWEPQINFADGVRDTILWYKNNPEWWKQVKSGAYQEYYDMYYNKRLGKQ